MRTFTPRTYSENRRTVFTLTFLIAIIGLFAVIIIMAIKYNLWIILLFVFILIFVNDLKINELAIMHLPLYLITRLIVGPMYYTNYEDRIKYLEKFIDKEFENYESPCRKCGRYSDAFIAHINVSFTDLDKTCECKKTESSKIRSIFVKDGKRDS